LDTHEEMTNANSFIELLRKMTHDVRAPLSSTISTVDMLIDGIYGPLTPKQIRANERIQRSSRRALAIIDDFTTYIKANAGQIDLVMSPFDPHLSLCEWCKQIQPTCEHKGLALHVRITHGVPPSLRGDVAIIGRAVLSLLWNAVAFTSEGAIWIDSDWSDTLGWTISIRDSGIGIPEHHISRIFEPFWRGDERPQVPSSGAGMGLAVSLALVKLMNGGIILEQTGSEGSRFRLHLQLDRAEH
jgi:signal transduction histidine kinase